jgi:hypothetical protein
MTELFAPTLDEVIASVEREIRYRERVYPRLVFNRKMTQAKADREIEMMRACKATLEGLRRPPTAS